MDQFQIQSFFYQLLPSFFHSVRSKNILSTYLTDYYSGQRQKNAGSLKITVNFVKHCPLKYSNGWITRRGLAWLGNGAISDHIGAFCFLFLAMGKYFWRPQYWSLEIRIFDCKQTNEFVTIIDDDYDNTDDDADHDADDDAVEAED